MNKPKLTVPDGESITINKTIPSKQFEDIFVIGTTNMNKYQEALNRIDTYRVNKSLKLDIKDILTLQELVDKETPKKPIPFLNSLYKCENCKGIFQNYHYQNRCPNCGQELDWSDAK